MKKEYEGALAKKYSFMQRGKSLEEQEKEGKITDLYSAFGCACDDGWYELLDDMCAKIQAVYDENDQEPDIVIIQIKQKFGTLRFYYRVKDNDAPAIHAIDITGQGSARMMTKGTAIKDKIADIVSDGERRSATICETCGHPGKTRNLMWIMTLCDDCYQKQKEDD